MTFSAYALVFIGVGYVTSVLMRFILWLDRAD